MNTPDDNLTDDYDAFMREMVPLAVEDGWIHVFYHDPERPFGRAVADGRAYRVEPLA